jgi:hypothetical protein
MPLRWCVGDIQPRGGWGIGSEADRRSKLRFPIALVVRYAGRMPPVVGAGRTVNLSSSGALIASQQGMSVGARIELFVVWPILLNGTTPLQFVAVGRVVRSGSSVFALSFERHEFRIGKKQPESASNDKGCREVG